jgi:hypothetical protein
MGKKFDELKIEFNKLTLKVDLLNEYVTEKFGFDEDAEKVKCRCKSEPEERLPIEPPRLEPLPEGVKFYDWNYTPTFLFGNKQLTCYDNKSDYLVTHFEDYLLNITNKCHLEPCKIEDLKAGDFFMVRYDSGVVSPDGDEVYLFISKNKYFLPRRDGGISTVTDNAFLEETKFKKAVYVP